MHSCPECLYSSVQEDDVLNQIRNAIKSAFEANFDRPLIENCIQNVWKEYYSQSENTQGEWDCMFVCHTYALLLFILWFSFIQNKLLNVLHKGTYNVQNNSSQVYNCNYVSDASSSK